MKNKLLLVLTSALVITTGGVRAQTAPPAPVATTPSHTLTATAAIATQYMFRGLRLSGAAFQPAVELAAGNATLGVWGNFPFDGDKVPDSSDPEFDIYGSYTFAINESLSIAPGFTSYHFPSAPENLGFYKWTFEPNLALNYTVQGFKFTPKIYYDTVLEGATYEVNAYYTVPLKDINSELGFVATYGTYKWKEFANDASPSVKAWGDYWLVGVAMPFQLTPKSKLTLGLAYTEGSDAFVKVGRLGRSVNSAAIARGVGTISYSHSF